MNPYPLSLLNHFTVPSAIRSPPVVIGSGDPPSCQRGNLTNGRCRCRRDELGCGGMRLVSYQGDEGICAGVQVVEDILDAGALLGERPLGARRLMEEGRLAELAELAGLEGGIEPASVTRLL